MKFFLMLIFFLWPLQAIAGLEGYDYYKTSNFVEFDEDYFEEGDSFYLYDYETGNYHIIDIESVQCLNSGCEIEIYDYEFGEYRYIEIQ